MSLSGAEIQDPFSRSALSRSDRGGALVAEYVTEVSHSQVHWSTSLASLVIDIAIILSVIDDHSYEQGRKDEWQQQRTQKSHVLRRVPKVTSCHQYPLHSHLQYHIFVQIKIEVRQVNRRFLTKPSVNDVQYIRVFPCQSCVRRGCEGCPDGKPGNYIGRTSLTLTFISGTLTATKGNK